MIRRVPLRAWVLGLGAIALSLRFAGLGQPHGIVFDEVYYAPFALNYLSGTPSFDAHPPLGKYLIALGIWLGQWPTAWLGWPSVAIDGALVSPLALRWLNAAVGATIPMLLAAIAWELGATQPETKKILSKSGQPSPLGRGRGGSAKANRGVHPIQRLILCRSFDPPRPFLPNAPRTGTPPEEGTGLSQTRVTTTQQRKRFALLAGLLMAMEGLTLVESRLALINIYGLALGLLGQWAWLRARHSPHPTPWRWTAAIALGAAINVKWNWAGLGLGLLLWEAAQFLGDSPHPKSLSLGERDFESTSNSPSPSERRGWGMRAERLPYLTLLPLFTYLLLWLPHLSLTGESLVGVHRQIWSTHQSISENASHAYCSPWHSWPLMLRPVAYFYEGAGVGEGAIATTIHAMGNPVLWWLSTAAVLSLALGWLTRRFSLADSPAQSHQNMVVSFILLNYLANWLPWVLVSRCTFLYHAMGMVAFSTLGLAWLMAQWLESPQHRSLALLLLGAIALSFFFWLPLYLGIPLSPEALQRRWLLPGWI